MSRRGGLAFGRRSGGRRRSAAALAFAWLLFGGPSFAQDTAADSPVKADFLIKFGAFVEWPAGAFATPDTPLEVCVVGHDPFGAALDRLAQGRSAGARAMVVRRMPAIAPGTGCRIAWLGGSPEQSVADAATQLAKAPVLTVTDGPSPASGVIHMVTQADRVRFEVDLAAAARAGLTISSKLLNLAVAVRR